MADRDVPSSTSVWPESLAPFELSTISDSDPFRLEGTPIVFVGTALAAFGAGDGAAVWAEASAGAIRKPASAAEATSRRRSIMVLPLSQEQGALGNRTGIPLEGPGGESTMIQRKPGSGIDRRKLLFRLVVGT